MVLVSAMSVSGKMREREEKVVCVAYVVGFNG